ncbi:MAG: 50S ribosomal protein L18e [Candidatus Hadarchaeales archaeon]
MVKVTGPTNPNLKTLIRRLRKAGKKARVWADVAERLSAPRRSRAEVNLSRINRIGGNAVIVVPGKVLGAGSLKGAPVVAAFKFSGAAARKIVKAGGKALTIEQLLEMNPEGKGVVIVE